MTRETAIKGLKAFRREFSGYEPNEEMFEMAIQALEQEPTTKNDLGVDCISRTELLQAMDTWDKFGYTETGCFVREPKGDYVPYVHYEDMVNCVKGMSSVTPQEPILDKIRAEIAEYGSIMVAYAITKETKTDKGIEKLVSDVLKQAKEQVLDIIDKYKTEAEPQESEDKDE